MSLQAWWLFSSAALVVILLPGPLSLLMVSNTLNYGLRRSLPAIAGGVSASLCLLSASTLGLGALLLASAPLFQGLKIAGALYLFHLAWQSWRSARQSGPATLAAPPAPTPASAALFAKAFGLGASNPKDILFFAAFLPQFIDIASPLTSQLLLMIATWTLLDLLCKLLYGLGARRAREVLRAGNGQCWFNRVSAGLFAGAGLAALLGAPT